MYGPTTDGAPDEQRRRELAQQAIDGSGSNVRSVLTFNSTDAIKAASSPYEYCPVADNSQFFVFFRLEYKSDVSVGWNVGREGDGCSVSSEGEGWRVSSEGRDGG